MTDEIFYLKKLFNGARKLHKEGRFGESISFLQNSADLWMDSSKRSSFLMLLGLNFLKQKEYERAERVLLEAQAISSSNLNVLNLLGQACFHMERYERAEKVFLSARNIDFFNFDYTLKAAKAAMKAGCYGRMFKRLKEGYIPDVLTEQDHLRLRRILLQFLANKEAKNSYRLVKSFRSFCYEKNRLAEKSARPM